MESLLRGRPRTGQAGPGYQGDTDHAASAFRLLATADPSDVEKDREVGRCLKDRCPGPVRPALTPGSWALTGKPGGLHPAVRWGRRLLQCLDTGRWGAGAGVSLLPGC